MFSSKFFAVVSTIICDQRRKIFVEGLNGREKSTHRNDHQTARAGKPISLGEELSPKRIATSMLSYVQPVDINSEEYINNLVSKLQGYLTDMTNAGFSIQPQKPHFLKMLLRNQQARWMHGSWMDNDGLSLSVIFLYMVLGGPEQKIGVDTFDLSFQQWAAQTFQAWVIKKLEPLYLSMTDIAKIYLSYKYGRDPSKIAPRMSLANIQEYIFHTFGVHHQSKPILGYFNAKLQPQDPDTSVPLAQQGVAWVLLGWRRMFQ